MEKLRKKDLKKAEEVLEALGGEEEKVGIQAAKEYVEAVEASHDAREADEKTVMAGKMKRIESYRDYLAKLLRDRLATVYAPPGFEVATAATPRGVAVALLDDRGRRHTIGFTPCLDLEMDLNAVDEMMLRAENTIYKIVMEKNAQSNEGRGCSITTDREDRRREGSLGGDKVKETS